MIYEYSLAIPANTPASAPVTLEAPLAPGKVLQVSVEFPSGCVGLVKTWATRSGHQVWPANLDETLKGDGQVVTWPEDYDLDDPPYELTLHGVNLDDTYPHTPIWRVALVEEAKIATASGSRSLLQRLASLFGL